MKNFIICAVLLAPCLLLALGLDFSFDNATISSVGGDLFYEFDLMLSAESSGSRLGTGITLISYNPEAFGTNVSGSGNVEVIRGAVLADNPPYPSFYNLIVNDNGPSTLSLTFEYMFSAGFGYPIGASPVQLMRIKLKVQNSSASSGIAFMDKVMELQQFMDDNATRYSPVTASGSLDQTLPVELSSFTAAVTLGNLVSISWITESETGVVGFKIHRGQNPELSNASQISEMISASNTSATQSYVFIDDEIYQDGRYYYWLEISEFDGSTAYHGPIPLDYTSVVEGQNPPAILYNGIGKIYPNPFNPTAYISYGLSQAGRVDLEIYNLRGQKVCSLVNGFLEAGTYKCLWDGSADNGHSCGSGVYLVRLRLGSRCFTERIMLMK